MTMAPFETDSGTTTRQGVPHARTTQHVEPGAPENFLHQFDLSGRVALVTGGSRGLGFEIAAALGEAGARVALVARRPDWLEPAHERLRECGIDSSWHAVDVTDGGAFQRLVGDVEEKWQTVDVLVNAAGVAWGEAALDTSRENFSKVVDVNLTGTFTASQAVARGMARRGRGSIVNITSVAGLRGTPAAILDAVGYSASKAGIVGLTRDLAVKWAPLGIRVNAIAPGFFPTRMTHGVLARSEAELVERIPLGRLGRAGEIGAVALFLASQASSYVTGQVLCVDGGITGSL